MSDEVASILVAAIGVAASFNCWRLWRRDASFETAVGWATGEAGIHWYHAGYAPLCLFVDAIAMFYVLDVYVPESQLAQSVILVCLWMMLGSFLLIGFLVLFMWPQWAVPPIARGHPGLVVHSWRGLRRLLRRDRGEAPSAGDRSSD